MLHNNYYIIILLQSYLMRPVSKFRLINNQDEIPLINQILNPFSYVF